MFEKPLTPDEITYYVKRADGEIISFLPKRLRWVMNLPIPISIKRWVIWMTGVRVSIYDGNTFNGGFPMRTVVRKGMKYTVVYPERKLDTKEHNHASSR